MKQWKIVVLMTAVVLSLSGCGGQASSSGGPSGGNTQAESTPSATKSTGAKVNERGNLVKHVGEKAGAFAADGKTEVASWTVTGIEKDFTCTSPSPQSSLQGHFVALDATVATSRGLKQEFEFGNGSTWKYIKKDGSVWNGDPESIPSSTCVAEADHLPNQMGPGLKAAGKVVFDLPDTDGYLVFPYTNEDGLRTTWEYPLS